jgi:hypothetical protein
VENAVSVGTLLRHSSHDVQELLQRCRHSSLRALGVVNPTAPPQPFDTKPLIFYTDRATRLPRLHNAEGMPTTAQVIIYHRPQPMRMQYLSLTPIALALDDNIRHPSWDAAFDQEERERKRREKLVEKLKLHRVISRPPSQEELALPMLIEQVNCSWELNALLQKNIGVIGRRMKRALSVSERMADSANDLWDYVYMALSYILWTWIWPLLSQIFVSALMANRVAAEVVLRVLHWHPAASPDAPALKDMSATAQQIDIRLQQFCYWPIQYLTLRKSRASWGSITNSHPDYIRFYNSLWLVANDIIMGIALGSYIMDNSELAAAKVDMIFSAWSIDGLRRMITWLMGWPGGLKLNTELADFLGDLFLWVIDYWAGRIPFFRVSSDANITRLHQSPSSTPSHTDTSDWPISIRWCYHAHLHVPGSGVAADTSHLLVLHCIGTNFPLATHHYDLALPSVPWQEAQRTQEPNRLVRLRSGSAIVGDDSVHTAVLLVANRICLLSDLCMCKGCGHWPKSCVGDWAGLFEPLPALRSDAQSQRPRAATWFVASHHHSSTSS